MSEAKGEQKLTEHERMIAAARRMPVPSFTPSELAHVAGIDRPLTLKEHQEIQAALLEMGFTRQHKSRRGLIKPVFRLPHSE